jgi:hypothetical protein
MHVLPSAAGLRLERIHLLVRRLRLVSADDVPHGTLTYPVYGKVDYEFKKLEKIKTGCAA